MMQRMWHPWAWMIMVGFVWTAARQPADGKDSSAALGQVLSNYVAAADASTTWKKTKTGKIGNTEHIEVILTSQTWRDIPWKHQLHILKPQNVDPDTKQAVLVIGGGRWREEYANGTGDAQPPRETALLIALAEALRTPVAILLQVPQQPMFDGMVEDEIISLTFEKFLRTQDPTWPLLLPMVKSAVRGMDTIESVCRDEWELGIEGFTITGASKRGWTTWLTGAVDKRATALAPMVIDTLNMGPQMEHQLTAWGKYSEEIQDYTERGLQDHMATEGGVALRAIVDPYSYRAQLTQPKLLMIGTNDRYWPLDALNLYWDDLAGDKYILYVPNNGHGLNDWPRVVGGVVGLHLHTTGQQPLPKLDWSLNQGNDGLAITVSSSEAPTAVRAWTAHSRTRDFREANWRSQDLSQSEGKFKYTLKTPQQGFAAAFAEVQVTRGRLPVYLSTNVDIIAADESATASTP